MESSQHDIALSDLSNPLGILPLEDHPSPNSRPDQSDHEPSLPQADGGKDAWLFLAAGFVVEAMVWGQFKRNISFVTFPSNNSISRQI